MWCAEPFEDDNPFKKFCKVSHKTKFQHRRQALDKRGLKKCHTPYKMWFGHRGTAIIEAAKRNQYFYSCDCGAYHLTSTPTRSNHNWEIVHAYKEKHLQKKDALASCK
jgi:hypothetical protein